MPAIIESQAGKAVGAAIVLAKGMGHQRLGLAGQIETNLTAKAGSRVTPGVVGAYQHGKLLSHSNRARRLGHQVRSRSCHDAHHRRVR